MGKFEPKAVFIPDHLKHEGVECTSDIKITRNERVSYDGESWEDEVVTRDYKSGTKYRIWGKETLLDKYPECFRPSAIIERLPEDAREGTHFDRKDCILLSYEGDNWAGVARSEDNTFVAERHFARWDTCEDGRVEWLPDVWIVKVSQREHWSEDVRKLTRGIWAIYAINRMEHIHICSFQASYAMHFIDFDHQPVEGLSEDQRESLWETINREKYDQNEVDYMNVSDVERILKDQKQFPVGEESSGYKFETTMVTLEGALEEVMEVNATSSL